MTDQKNEMPQPQGRRDSFKVHAVALAYTLSEFRVRRLINREMRAHTARLVSTDPNVQKTAATNPDWLLQLPDSNEIDEISEMLRNAHERGFEDGRSATVDKLVRGTWRPDWLVDAGRTALEQDRVAKAALKKSPGKKKSRK